MPRRSRPIPKPRDHKDGTRTWVVRYRLGAMETTQVFRHTSRNRETMPRDALQFCADIYDLTAHVAHDRLVARMRSTAVGPTVAKVFEEFVEWKAPRVRSDRTIESYRAQFARGIAPTFARRHIDAVTDADVQRWVDAMVAGTIGGRVRGGTTVPLHPKTIANYHGLLHSVFAFAASSTRAYVSVNPCAGTDLPKRRKGQVKGFRPGEAAAMHAALRAVDPDAADLAQAMHATGARLGEVTALSTWDVEDDGSRVTLNIGHVIRRRAGGTFERVEDTKSEAGFRRVRVVGATAAMVRRRTHAAATGGLVFTNRHGRMWVPATVYASWNKAAALANLSRRPTPHWWRHTHVAELIEAGVPMAEIQARVGHENFATTVGVYGRLVAGVGDAALDAIEARRMGGGVVAGGPVVAGEIVG